MLKPKMKSAPADDGPVVVVRSDDGNVCFRLHPTRSGLWVERERQQKCHQARLVHSVVFASLDKFARWCESDSVRFDYPIVFSIIKREGGALLLDHEQTASTERNHEAP